MSSALDAASLIMYPSGYSDGVLGSAKPTDGSGDFTFTRGSNLSATRVGPNGYIEKGYENLLTYSNDFSNVAWTKTRVDLTSGQAGYDGSNDAWLVTNNNDSFPRLETSATSSGVSTYSVYAKAGTNSFCQLRTFGADADVWFDLSNGSSPYTTGTGLIDTNSEAIGNGWYRLSLIVNGNLTGVRIYSASAFAVYGLGSIYIQDAMLNQGLVAYPYIETTTAPVAGGILEDEPRIDFSDGCGHLLLEPSRTNLVPHSEYFGGWSAIGSTQTLINDTNPIDSVAYEIESSVTGSTSRIYQNGLMTSGNDYSSSYLVKPSSNSPEYLGFACISNLTPDVLYNFATDSFEDFNIIGNAAKCESISMNNGWKLLKVPVHENVVNTRFNIYQGSKVGSQLNGTTGQSYYLKFAQLEQDATYPTSYIPTYGVSQTRLADVYGGDDISSLVGDNQGTLFVEWEENPFLNSASYVSSVGLFQPTGFERIIIEGRSSALRIASTISGTNFGSYSAAGSLKIAVKYNGSELISFVNGAELDRDVQTDTFNPASFGHTSTYVTAEVQENIKEIILFPTALSDDECIALTTI